MQVQQSACNVLQNGTLLVQRKIGCLLQEVIQVGVQTLHDQCRNLSSWEETEAKEQCDVGVTKVGHHFTLLQKLLRHLCYSFMLYAQEIFMNFLGSTDKLPVLHLKPKQLSKKK